ncbi:MAG TPA: hypothetical protein PK315_01000 [Petrotogaceae bacterium]|jgi:hypothetical protein|nr:hypothetical protein [Petrotogaceae bacterium]
MKTTEELVKKGDFKRLFGEYKEKTELKQKMDEFRQGYYNYRRNDCMDCLACFGGLACADTLCECSGGDLCRCI